MCNGPPARGTPFEPHCSKSSRSRFAPTARKKVTRRVRSTRCLSSCAPFVPTSHNKTTCDQAGRRQFHQVDIAQPRREESAATGCSVAVRIPVSWHLPQPRRMHARNTRTQNTHANMHAHATRTRTHAHTHANAHKCLVRCSPNVIILEGTPHHSPWRRRRRWRQQRQQQALHRKATTWHCGSQDCPLERPPSQKSQSSKVIPTATSAGVRDACKVQRGFPAAQKSSRLHSKAGA